MGIAFQTKAESVTGANGTTSLAATAPAGIVDGDLLIAAVAVGTTGTPTISGPAGWTKVAAASGLDSGAPGNALEIWYKIAASESGTYTFTSSVASARMRIHIHRYSGVDPTTPIGNGAYLAATSATTARATGTATALAGQWGFVAFSDTAGSSYTMGAGLTERTDVASAGNTAVGTADTNGGVSAGSLSYSATSTSNNTTSSGTVVFLNPAAAAAVTVDLPISVALTLAGTPSMPKAVALPISVALTLAAAPSIPAAVALPIGISLGVAFAPPARTVALPIGIALGVAGTPSMPEPVALPISVALTLAGTPSMPKAIPLSIGISLTLAGAPEIPAAVGLPIGISLGVAFAAPARTVALPISVALTLAAHPSITEPVALPIGISLHVRLDAPPMTMRYPAQVWIDDDILPSVWGDEIATALDELSIVWGREDIYAEPEPAIATVRVLTREPAWATDNDLVGKRLLIRRPEAVMFRGAISETAPELIEVWNETLHRNDEVWLVTVTAADVTAELAQAHVPGPEPMTGTSSGGLWVTYATPGAFARQTPTERIASLTTVGATNFVDSFEVVDIVAELAPPFGSGDPLGKIHVEDDFSLLDVIRTLYSGIPLGHTNYNPDTNGMEQGRPATEAGMALVLDSGLLTLEPDAGYTLPAGLLEMHEGKHLVATVQSAIDRVDARWKYENQGQPDRSVEVYRSAYTSRPAGGLRTLRLRSWLARASSPIIEDQIDAAEHWLATPLAQQTATIVDEINGQFLLPPLRFDFRRSITGDADLDGLLLDTKDQPRALYFPGSLFEHVPNVGPQHQIIGGTLTWYGTRATAVDLPAGWTHDLTLAPATGAGDTVSIEDLVTNTGPALEDFDPDVTIEGLGTVTEGYA